MLKFLETLLSNKRVQEDEELKHAIKQTATAFHLTVFQVTALNWDDTQENPTVMIDGLDRFYFKGARSLRLPAGVLANTLRAEILKHLPQTNRNHYIQRIAVSV